MKNMCEILFWNRHTRLVHGYSTKKTGNLSFRSGSRKSVEHSRRQMVDDLAINWEDVLILPLSHSNKVLSLPKTSQLSRSESGLYLSGGHVFLTSELIVHNNPEWQGGVDGIVTDKKGLFPVIMSADCAAVALYDPIREVVGFVHAGLIGAVNRIVPRAIGCMIEEYSCNPMNIEVVIFPSIRKCHYDLSKSGAWKRIQDDVIGHYGTENLLFADNLFDLQGILFQQLVTAGIRRENIFDTGLCTVCNNDLFFSNLIAGNDDAKKMEGRFASIVGMKI